MTVSSIWQPLFGPIRDYPLAVCDSRSVTEEDLVESDYIYQNLESENFMVRANKAHRWYYMKDQSQDDVLIITNFDSKTGRRMSFKLPLLFYFTHVKSGVLHSGFKLPTDESITRLRESFEIRVVVYQEH